MEALNRLCRVLDEIAVIGMLGYLFRSFRQDSAALPRGLVLVLIVVLIALIWDLITLFIIRLNDWERVIFLAPFDIALFVALIVGVVVFAPWVLDAQKNHCGQWGGILRVNITWSRSCVIPKVLWSLSLGLAPSFLLSVAYPLMAAAGMEDD